MTQLFGHVITEYSSKKGDRKEKKSKEENQSNRKIRKNTSEKTLGPCNKPKKRFYAKEKKGISNVKKRKKGDERICRGTVEKRVHQTLKVTLDFTSILYGEKK